MHQSETLCQYLSWDSQFFDKRIARVVPSKLSVHQAQAIDSWCETHAIDCIYMLTVVDDPQTTRIVEDFGYHHMDVRMVYNYRLVHPTQSCDLPADVTVETATAADIPSLTAMIDNSFALTRFYYDMNFDNDKANELYKIWLRRSITDTLADEVFVFKKDDTAHGFITCSLNAESQMGQIGLLSVSYYMRGQNMAQCMIEEAFRYFSAHGMQQVEVVTQARNIRANRLYQKCGFRMSNVFLWYHKWYTS